MTPRHDGSPDHEDGDPQEQVRRLLAAAATSQDPQMPEDVATRLDDVLAGLAAERGSPPRAGEGPVPAEEVAGVTELAARRRPRRPRLLLTAAAVAVVALGTGVGVHELTGGGSQSVTAESGAADSASQRKPSEPALPNALTGGPVPLHDRTLRSDLQRIEDSGVAVPVASSARSWREACTHPRTGHGDEWVPVRLDGRSGVLVLRAPRGGRRTGEVFLCSSADTPDAGPAASATIEAR